jgi:RimJ/RimL family protein N-acetyltransferase
VEDQGPRRGRTWMVKMAVLFVTESLTVREFEPPDSAAVLSVYKESEDFLSLGPVPAASMEMVIADMEHSAAANGRFCVIQRADGEVVGVLDFSAHAAGDTALLSLLMISRQHRNKGYGSAVVDALELYLHGMYRVRTIEGGVQTNNPGAMRFWRSRGFLIGTVGRLHEDGTTACEMKKNLGPRERRTP